MSFIVSSTVELFVSKIAEESVEMIGQQDFIHKIYGSL